MFLDKPYSVISKDVLSYHKLSNGGKFRGIDCEIEIAVIWKYGVDVSVHESDIYAFTEDGKWKFEDRNKIDFKRILKGKRAVMSVPSLNFTNKGHAIFWDGSKLLDPSNLKRYTAEMAFDKAYRVVVRK
jgi:hypothetical protein